MEVRLLKASDRPLLAKLVVGGGPYVSFEDSEEGALFLGQESQDWGLWVGGELVGWCRLTGRAPLVWVSRVVIAPAYRGQGYGYTLLREVLTKLRRYRRYREVKAAVHPDNLPAKRLFSRLGFEALPYEALVGEIVFRLAL